MEHLSILNAILLGALQGATEFLPVSSSGHLVIAQDLLGVRMENGALVAFDVCLHVGTLAAVCAVFWRDLADMARALLGLRPAAPDGGERLSTAQARRLALLIVVGTIPAVILGFTLKDFFESLFTDAVAAAGMLLVTGFILFGTRFVKHNPTGLPQMRWWQALVVGIAQAVAIVPGISRSGSTIAGGLYLGLDRGLAARFAFLLAIPAIGGAALLQGKDIMLLSAGDAVAAVVGTVVSAVVGFVCVKWMLSIVRHRHFSWFAYYCWAAGLAVLIYFL